MAKYNENRYILMSFIYVSFYYKTKQISRVHYTPLIKKKKKRNTHTLKLKLFHRKDDHIHRSKKQVSASISYLVTTPSSCSIVDAGPSQQPLGSGLSYNVCLCTMYDYGFNMSQLFLCNYITDHNTYYPASDRNLEI